MRLAILPIAILLAGFNTGCESHEKRPSSIHFILPDNYVGKLEVVLDPEQGRSFRRERGTNILEFPVSGKVQLKSFMEFEKPYIFSASYRSGASLAIDPDAVIAGSEGTYLWNLGSILGTSFPNKTLIFAVGNAKQRDEIAAKVRPY